MTTRATRWRRRAFPFAVATSALLIAQLLLAAPADAHATLQESRPANSEIVQEPPTEVTLRFDEPVDVFGSGVRVFGPDGNRVDRGRAEIDGMTVTVPIDASADGTYSVAWRVLSGDSHNLASTFVFHVRVKTGAATLSDDSNTAADALGGLGRFGAFAGATVLLGAALLAWRARDEVAVARRLRAVSAIAGAVAVVAVVMVLVAQAAQASGRPVTSALSLTWDLATNTRTGRLTALRGLLLGVATGTAVVRLLWERARWLPLVASAASLVAVSTAGHPWTSSSRAVAVTSDVAHQALVGAWIGGIVALLLTVRLAEHRSRLVGRFSALALWCVVGVAISGTVSGFLQVRTIEALRSTGYGQLLLLKVAGFLVLCGLGWLNRHRYIPALERALNPLVRSLRRETAVAALVLATTAGLVNQPPAATSVAKPFETTVVVAGARMLVSVSPAKVGLNDLHMYFFDEDGSGAFAVDAVEVTATVGDLPPRRVQVTPVSATHQSVFGASLPSPGLWTFEVTALSAGTKTVFEVKVPVR